MEAILGREDSSLFQLLFPGVGRGHNRCSNYYIGIYRGKSLEIFYLKIILLGAFQTSKKKVNKPTPYTIGRYISKY